MADAGTQRFVFAGGREIEANSLLQVNLELGADVDLASSLLRIEDLWVDGREESGAEIGIDDAGTTTPSSTRLLAAHPNPFNPTTSISFVVGGETHQPAPVRLGIYDLAGRLIRELVREPLAPGPHQVRWLGVDDAGRRAASGTYFLRLEQGEFVVQQKLTLLK